MQQARTSPEGMHHLRKALSNCKYPRWSMDRMERRFSQLTSDGKNNANTQVTTGTEPTTTEFKTKGHIGIPYTQGLCKSIMKICSKYGIQIHFRGNRAIKISWCLPRTRTLWRRKGGLSTGCNAENMCLVRST